MNKEQTLIKYVKVIEEILNTKVTYSNLSDNNYYTESKEDEKRFIEIETNSRIMDLQNINNLSKSLIAENVQVYSRNDKICLHITMKKI